MNIELFDEHHLELFDEHHLLPSAVRPHINDVICGRGAGSNHHPGNRRYRKIVAGRKDEYANTKDGGKIEIAKDILRQWRAQCPPGRFLKKDRWTGMYDDVGDKTALLKIQQALRERKVRANSARDEDSEIVSTFDQDISISTQKVLTSVQNLLSSLMHPDVPSPSSNESKQEIQSYMESVARKLETWALDLQQYTPDDYSSEQVNAPRQSVG